MRKNKQFSIRISAQDLETIRQKAVQAHMSQSDYVTACCLGKRIVILDGLREVLRQQKAIGNNLNQLSVQRPQRAVRRVSPLCAAFQAGCDGVRSSGAKANVAPPCGQRRKMRIQYADPTQRSPAAAGKSSRSGGASIAFG